MSKWKQAKSISEKLAGSFLKLCSQTSKWHVMTMLCLHCVMTR